MKHPVTIIQSAASAELSSAELDLVRRNPLFQQIKADDVSHLLTCLSAQKALYAKDSFVLRAAEPAAFLGIVLAGRVHVIQEDFWGYRNILTHAAAGEIFAEAFSCAETESLPVSVIAAETSAVLQLNYRRMISLCTDGCTFHNQMIHNMMQILASKNISLTHKMQQLSRRSTREKIVSFLSDLAAQKRSDRFTIPYNRQEMADYLCVDRSALSRELGKLQAEGILEFERNHFRLNPQRTQATSN